MMSRIRPVYFMPRLYECTELYPELRGNEIAFFSKNNKKKKISLSLNTVKPFFLNCCLSFCN